MNGKKHVFIIFSKYYDFDRAEFTLGGVQTYLHHLIPVFRELGYACSVFGTGYPEARETEVGGIRIVNVPTKKGASADQQVRTVLREAERYFCNETDILLFATDCQIAPNGAKRSIVIQHGITWDIPAGAGLSVAENNLFIFRKAHSLWKKLKKISMAKKAVCVDYNYVNWYRASTAYEAVPMTVIPNFTETHPRCEKPGDRVRVIFARRLETYRGSQLFARVMRRILTEYEGVDVTVAGKGPCESEMREILAPFAERVDFISYQADKSFSVHADKHIAVVPTVGSEGTSLSLLEGMAAGCAVVCTNVGGMTNIVLDGYNGLMVSAREEELYRAIVMLIRDRTLRESLAEKGYETVSAAFSLERWQNRWRSVIAEVEEG